MNREGIDDPMEVEAGPAETTWLDRLRHSDVLISGSCACGNCYKIKENPLFRIASENVNAIKPEILLQSIESVGYVCIAEELAAIIVDLIIEADTIGNNPVYGFDRWRIIDGFLKDNIETFGLHLYLRLLESESEWILYNVLASVWRCSYHDKDVTPVGLRIATEGGQKPLINLLLHPNQTILLSVIGVVVTVLHGLDEKYQMSFIDNGIVPPLKHIMMRKSSNVVLTKTINVLGWLSCGGRSCQLALVNHGVLECLIPLLYHHHAEVVRSAWMATNWLIYSDEGKQRFLKSGGLELLLKAFERKDFSSGVIFATRKLAMHQGCKSELLQRGVHEALINCPIVEDRMRYVISLALSFLCINPASPNEEKMISDSGALDYIARSVSQIRIDQDLNVLYTNLIDQKTLITSTTPQIQYFGMYWTLHLLVGEQHGYYKRKDYASMVLHDGLLPVILKLLHPASYHPKDLLLAKMACSIVHALCLSQHVKARVASEGGFTHCQRFFQEISRIEGFNPTPVIQRSFHNYELPGNFRFLASNPQLSKSLLRDICEELCISLDLMLRDRTLYAVSPKQNLKNIAEDYVIEHVERDNLLELLDFAVMQNNSRLELYCSCTLYHDTEGFFEQRAEAPDVPAALKEQVDFLCELRRLAGDPHTDGKHAIDFWQD